VLLASHYKNYSDTNELMSYEQFYDFYKDFSIFPDVINSTTMKNIFFFLTEALGQLIKEENSKNSKYIIN
jgi:hypothetical protein